MNPTLFLRRPISHPTGLGMTCGGMSQAHLQPERAMNYKARTGAGFANRLHLARGIPKYGLPGHNFRLHLS